MRFAFKEFKVLIDSREQKPFSFENEVEIRGLKTGDYSIDGYEDCIGVERKSLNDLIGSLTYNRKRFKAELERAKQFKHFAIIVEGSYFDLYAGSYRSTAAPKSMVGSVIGIMAEFGFPVMMAETRKQAQENCSKFLRLSLMREYEEQKEE